MGNLITIYKGDENRAKIDTALQPGVFLDTAYNRAFQALEKIVCETQEYRKENEQNGCKSRFNSMGNNTIIFTAERGQGKTSAMRSFAEALKQPQRYTDRMKNMDSVGFCVLDVIDPAVFDKKENIIRVLLSQLYFEFDRYSRDCLARNKSYMENAGDSERFLTLLTGCYDNIEVLKGNGNRNEEEDDLEHLAQLGNSAKLRENLNDLIEIFLKLMLENAYRYHYLVIQIDDVDLSTGDIYEICEDIHRYFSVPNVVVLMAADYSQLRYALCEKYLKQYKELQNERSKIKIYDKCHDMATRYLEKVFPENHRIELPVLRNIRAEDYNNLRICYCSKTIAESYLGADRKTELAASERLCEYLKRLLYQKTGIILLNAAGRVHPLLPRTMRELAHFLNLLDEMPDIDMVAVCSDFICSNEKDDLPGEEQNGMGRNASDAHMEDRENLVNNLFRLKRYYFYDWCTNYLDETQWDLIQAVEACEPQRKLQLTVSLLRDYISRIDREPITVDDGQTMTEQISYRKVMEFIENNKILQDRTDFQTALLIYYTLFLNEWFIKGMGQVETMRRLTDFTGNLVHITKKVENCKVNGFAVNSFDISARTLRKRLDKIFAENPDSYKLYLQATCVPQMKQGKDPSEQIDEELEKWITTIWPSSIATEKLHFDYFRSLTHMLFDSDWRTWVMDRRQSVDEQHRDEKTEPSRRQQIAEIILAIKNAVTNYSVQQKIQSDVEEMIDALETKRQSNDSLEQYYNRLNKELDKWREGTEYDEGIVPAALEKGLALNLKESGCLNDILLSTEENVKAYNEQYAEKIRNIISLYMRNTENIKRILAQTNISDEKMAYEILSLTQVLVQAQVEDQKPALINGNVGLTNGNGEPDNEETQRYNRDVEELRELYRQLISEVDKYIVWKEQNDKKKMSVSAGVGEEKADTEKSVQTGQKKQSRNRNSVDTKQKKIKTLIDQFMKKIQEVENGLDASGTGKS